MIQKLCITFVAFLFSFFSVSVLAQTTGDAVKKNADATNTNTAAGMYARFCDSTVEEQGKATRTKIVVSPGKTYDLCIDLLNLLDEESSMHVSFVDGQKDQNGNLGCEEESRKAVFGQYVTGVDESVTIPANGFKRVTAKIKMPASAAGTVYGCVAVYNNTVFGNVQKQGGVSTLLRNAIPLEMFVDTKVDVGLELAPVTNIEGSNLVSDPVFVSKQPNGTYVVAVGFKNIGGLDESVEVAGTMTDTLKKVTELAPQTKIVAPEAFSDVRYEIPALPWYKMWFTVDMTVTHNAVSEFRTEFITEKLLEKKTITVNKTFFVFPWWLVGVLIVLALIIHLIKRSSKHHHDEEKELEDLKKWKAEHATPQQ